MQPPRLHLRAFLYPGEEPQGHGPCRASAGKLAVSSPAFELCLREQLGVAACQSCHYSTTSTRRCWTPNSLQACHWSGRWRHAGSSSLGPAALRPNLIHVHERWFASGVPSEATSHAPQQATMCAVKIPPESELTVSSGKGFPYRQQLSALTHRLPTQKTAANNVSGPCSAAEPLG